MLRYSKHLMGRFTLTQDTDGEHNVYHIQIRSGNCLAVFMNIYKLQEPDDPKRPWVHQLVAFLADEKHIKNIVKENKDWPSELLYGKVSNIRLNVYYKESVTLLKYFTRAGYRVSCYYKEPTK